LESSSSDTFAAVNEIWKNEHGLQEYSVLLVDVLTSDCLNTANRGGAQDITLSLNKSVAGFCTDINALPVKLMSDPASAGN
jgi:hypothetical protein